MSTSSPPTPPPTSPVRFGVSTAGWICDQAGRSGSREDQVGRHGGAAGRLMSAGNLKPASSAARRPGWFHPGTTDRNRRPAATDLACSTTVRASTLLRPRPTRSGRRPNATSSMVGSLRGRERVRLLRSSSTRRADRRHPGRPNTLRLAGAVRVSLPPPKARASPHCQVHAVLDGQLSYCERESRLCCPRPVARRDDG